jgi:putative transposase
MPPTVQEIAIKHRIDEIYTKYPFYGSRRITVQLRREEVLINRKAVQRHMQEDGYRRYLPGTQPKQA